MTVQQFLGELVELVPYFVMDHGIVYFTYKNKQHEVSTSKDLLKQFNAIFGED